MNHITNRVLLLWPVQPGQEPHLHALRAAALNQANGWMAS